MLIFDHERERRILERRLELSEILDSIVRRDIAFGTTTDPESPEVRHITEQFDSVLHPRDVCNSVKAIYEDRPNLFGPEKL